MREQTITYRIYKFDELSDKAKEKARDWYRNASCNDEWWEMCYDTMIEDLNEIGIEVDKRNPFFFSIGRDWHLQLNSPVITDDKKLFAALIPEIKIRTWEFDLLANAISLDTLSIRSSNTRLIYDLWNIVDQGKQPKIHKKLHSILETLSDRFSEFREKLLEMLEAENEYQYSDEYIDDQITCNEYEFLEDGTHARF